METPPPDPDPEAAGAVTPEILELVRRQQVANIITKVNSGTPITDRELRQLHDAAEKTASKGIAPPEPESPPAAASAPKFSASNYTEIYKTSKRGVERWIAAGRKVANLPPLDHPASMPEWWGIVYGARMPEGVRLAAANANRSPADSPPQASPLPFAEITDPESLGLAAARDRTVLAERTLFQLWQNELAKPDSKMTAQAQTAWEKTVERLRALERTCDETLERKGELIARKTVERLLEELHVPIRRGLHDLLPKWSNKIGVGITAEGEGEWAKIIEEFCAEIAAPLPSTP